MTGVLAREFFEEEVLHEAGVFADGRYAVGLGWGETDWHFLAGFDSTVFHAACVDGDDVTG